MDELTPRQAQVLQVIRDFLQESGFPPTRAEIARELGFRSLNAAEDHLKVLARKGFIEMLPGASRGIRLTEGAGLCRRGAQQLLDYVEAGERALGAVPSFTTVVIERFFDESGGMQLVVHSPFGSRTNRAWGLALRKLFCRSFNLEL